MLHVIEHTLLDTINLIPFLFLVFLFMEYLEHKMNKKSKSKIAQAGKFGPLFGSLLGAFPQCGFSAAATNLYCTRVISLGTLIAVYLSTSDEMLPIFISNKVGLSFIIYVIIIKVIIGMIAGFVIDFILRKKVSIKNEIGEFCDDEHCDCKHSILKSSFHHTLSIFLFIFIVEVVLNIIIHYLGTDALGSILITNKILGPFLASLVGLIPNCASSVVITELFLNGAINFGSLIGGLLTGSGVGLLILFKVNKNIKENIMVLTIVYFIGAICGVLINLLGIL